MTTNGDRRSNTPTTVVKYEKSSCCFCNEWLDSQSFTEHLIHCGQVLEKCPKSCNSHVPRIRLRAHIKECSKSKQSRQSSEIEGEVVSRIMILEQDIDTLRSVLNEEIRQRLHLITDVGSLRKQNQTSKEWTQRTDENLHELRQRFTEENTQRCFEIEQCQNDFRYCFDLAQTLKIDLQQEMSEIGNHIAEVSSDVNKQCMSFLERFAKLEDNILQQEKNLRLKIAQLEKAIEEITFNLHTKLIANTELNTKQLTMDYEVKSMKNIVCDTEERCEKAEQITADLDKVLRQTIQRVTDLEMHLTAQQRVTSIQNTKGHLIWRIREFSKRMEEARQFDTILHSAMFANKPFGYALRLDVHLNGKGTWKDRNIIACLNVLSGEFDALLRWPCKLQADIIVRDQADDLSHAQDFVKTIIVRKKNDQIIHSNQYFHIPHKLIGSRNYLRNDCIFIEIRVHKQSATKYF